MKGRVYYGAKLARGGSRARAITLEIVATVLLAAVLGTSHAQVGVGSLPAPAQLGTQGSLVDGLAAGKTPG
jgi:hypothetical protein